MAEACRGKHSTLINNKTTAQLLFGGHTFLGQKATIIANDFESARLYTLLDRPRLPEKQLIAH